MGFNGWLYKQSFVVTSVDQIRFTVYKGSGTPSGTDLYCEGHCNDDFSDIRFSIDGDVAFSYYIESYVSGTSADIVVNFGEPVESQIVWMVYGNGSAISESSGNDTFELFDDFTYGSSLDPEKWNVNSGQPYDITDNVLRVYGASDNNDSIRSVLSFGIGVIVKARFRFQATGNWYGRFGFVDPESIKAAYWYGLSGGACFNCNSASQYDGTVVQGSTFYTYEIRRISTSSLLFIRDGTTIKSRTDSYYIPDNDLLLQFVEEGSSSYSMYCDWIYVMKVDASGPTVSDWTAEEDNITETEYYTINEIMQINDVEYDTIITVIIETMQVVDSSVRAIHMRIINEIVGLSDTTHGFLITVINELMTLKDNSIVAYIMNEVMGLRAGDDPLESAGHDEYGRSVGRRMNEYGHHVYGRLTMYGNRITGLFKTKTNTEAVVIPQFSIIEETVVIESNGDELDS